MSFVCKKKHQKRYIFSKKCQKLSFIKYFGKNDFFGIWFGQKCQYLSSFLTFKGGISWRVRYLRGFSQTTGIFPPGWSHQPESHFLCAETWPLPDMATQFWVWPPSGSPRFHNVHVTLDPSLTHTHRPSVRMSVRPRKNQPVVPMLYKKSFSSGPLGSGSHPPTYWQAVLASWKRDTKVLRPTYCLPEFVSVTQLTSERGRGKH